MTADKLTAAAAKFILDLQHAQNGQQVLAAIDRLKKRIDEALQQNAGS